MIPFFRRIRKKMADDNKPMKYMRYAIGEIVLVVIGILIALQINNWNQQRLQNKEEQKALINLKHDFEFNYNTLDSVLNKTKKNLELQFLILNHTGNKPDPKTEDEFNISLNVLLSLEVFYPRNGYLDDLLNSGKLGIIKNQNLRNRLSSWNPALDNIKASELSVEAELQILNNYISKKGSWLNADAVGTSETVKNNPFPKSGFDIDNRDLLDEIEFENKTENIIYLNAKLGISHYKGLKLIQEILDIIEKEIGIQ